MDGARVYEPHYVNLCGERCQPMSSFRLRWALDSGGGKTNTQVTNCAGGTESFITTETRAYVLSDFLSSWRLKAQAKGSDAK